MILVKIGGGADIDLQQVVSDIAKIEEDVIIIHGANALRDELAEKLGVEKEVITSLSGFSSVKSTDDLIDLMLMSYSGLRNKRLVGMLQQEGVNALGLTGADGRLVRGRRNRGIKTRINGKKMIIRDNSGKPAEINTDLLQMLLENGYTPVITQPIMDKNGILLNSENDDMVALISNEMNIDDVVMLIEAPGFLRDIDDPSSVIENVDSESIQGWIETADKRMKRKLYAIQQMMRETGPQIHVSDGRIENPVTSALQGNGTSFQHSQ